MLRHKWSTCAVMILVSVGWVGFGSETCLGQNKGDQEAAPPPQLATAVGEVSLKVVLISSDLSLKPVPKKPFVITPVGADDPRYPLTTSFSGEATLQLPAGRYRIRTVEPMSFEGKVLSWDVEFQILPKEKAALELSSDNATAQKQMAATGERVETNEGRLYHSHKSGVFTVVSESGHGSGFLVDSRGLVLTNNHVVTGSDYLAVKCDASHKYLAAVLVSDPTNDLAVLMVNPGAVKDRPVLALAEDNVDYPPVSIGDRVLAIGSPLATETILTSGLVSKIEEGAIYSDISINPGNSGGPLFNSAGSVVGVNTFRMGTPGAPGVSGIVRIFLAKKLLDEARTILPTVTLPPDRLLPVESSFRFPAEKLREAAINRAFRPKDYHLNSGKVDVQIITPAGLAALEVQAEKEAAEGRKKRKGKDKDATQYEPGKDFYEWRRYAGDYRPVVRIQAVPEVGMTGGSIFAVIMLGPNVPVKMKFKTDFKKMELKRGDSLVEPITPGRIPNVANWARGNASMKDVAYYGMYEYPPEGFKPGTNVTLDIWEEGKDKPIVNELSSEQVRLIWDDFEEYYEALALTVSGEVSGENREGSSRTEDHTMLLDFMKLDSKWHSTNEMMLNLPILRGRLLTALESLTKSGSIEVNSGGDKFRIIAEK